MIDRHPRKFDNAGVSEMSIFLYMKMFNCPARDHRRKARHAHYLGMQVSHWQPTVCACEHYIVPQCVCVCLREISTRVPGELEDLHWP